MIFRGVTNLLLLLVYAAVVATRSLNPVTEEDLDYGIKMWLRAYEATCWYEGGMKFPTVHNTGIYIYCSLAMAFQKQVHQEDLQPHPTKAKMQWYAQQWFTDETGPLNLHPEEYKRECFRLVGDPHAKPRVDESKTIEDGGREYPFRAFSYCLMHIMRKSGGNKIIETWKNDRLNEKKDWRQVLLERDNSLRARHGSKPFKMTEKLVKGAQQWAEQMAKECKMYHSPQDTLFQNVSNPLGENIASATMIDDFAMMGLIATNTWYGEEKNYCYPDEFETPMESNPPGCELSGPKQTGHFTALVWKGSKKVGYGTACNPKCQTQGMCYTVARYSVIGNHVGLPGAFKENVQPPKY